MSSKINPFDVLNGMTKGKLYSEEDVKASSLNTFLLINYMRGSKVLLPLAEFINSNWKMNFYDQYLLSFFTFKALDIRYMKWIKADKGIKVEYIQDIQRYYSVNYKTAFMYLEIMKDEDIDYIVDFYKTGGKRNV